MICYLDKVHKLMIYWIFEKLLVEQEHMFDTVHSEDHVEDSDEDEDVGDVNDVEHIHRLRLWDYSRVQVLTADN